MPILMSPLSCFAFHYDSGINNSNYRIYNNVFLFFCFFIFFINLFDLFIFYFWLRWVFVAAWGLLIAVASLVAEHGL